MRVRLVLSLLAGVAAFVPVLPAATAFCTGPVGAGGVAANVCTEGVAAVPGGFTSASSFAVNVNGRIMRWCVARTTVTTSGIEHDPRTLYPC